MSYQHKSGAKKRKEREAKAEKEKKGQTTFDKFFYKKKKDEDEESEVSIQEPGTQSMMTAFVKKPSSDGAEAAEKKPKLSVAASVAKPSSVVENICSMNLSRETDESNKLVSPKKLATSKLWDFDIGTIKTTFLAPLKVNEAVRRGPEINPKNMPDDTKNRRFPYSLLFVTLPNGEKVSRDWLVWSKTRKALFCFPCRLFSKHSTASSSAFSLPSGYSVEKGWKKLYDRVPHHHNLADHQQCYMNWRKTEKNIENESSIDCVLLDSIKTEAEKWRQILTRILDVILFLGERGLALRGDNHLIGDPRNGNFLGILELISRYDPVLDDHLKKVKMSQQLNQRLQVHYLSPVIQNEFVEICANHVINAILKQREVAKYYSLIVDATPDSAHVEQTTFVLRYVFFEEKNRIFTIQERFLSFVDCNKKTGKDIADLIQNTLLKYGIPLSDCRGQGYDNGSNMKGCYNGAQNHILQENPLAPYSPCGCHTLNLCGVDAAECCVEAVTFFGVVQKCYNIFSSSPQRWEILKKHIGCSLHGISNTRWSARVDCVQPFAAHIPGIADAIGELQTLNLTAETRTDLAGILTYIKSFNCIVMASVWVKILTSIDYVNTVLQARQATMDVEMKNIDGLITELKNLRDKWQFILDECKLVAENLKLPSQNFVSKRNKKIKVFHDEDSVSAEANVISAEDEFKRNVFYVILDSLISGMSHRYTATKLISSTFNFLWKFPEKSDQEICDKTKNFVAKYNVDVSEDLVSEMKHLKQVHEANLEPNQNPLQLLNNIFQLKLENLFPNVCIALRIFCCMPVSVASAERSFSVLARIKDYHRSTSSQNRTTSLATLALESTLARNLDFKALIDSFANAKARKAHIKN